MINSDNLCCTNDKIENKYFGLASNQLIEERDGQILSEYIIKFMNDEKFNSVRKKLRVLARTTSEDKFVLISGTKQRGGIVSMTGDSISDAEALKKADIGLCMGSGCDVAKDNSDLVILDNNF